MAEALPVVLRIAAAGQAVVAALNLALVRILHWEEEVAALPLLMRQVFQVHKWFISIILIIFAVLTWRFADEMNALIPCRWMAGAIAVFWSIRTFIQIGYYSAEHWRGQAPRTAVHIILLVAFGGVAIAYGLAALGFPW